jgi:hypothetical protein
MNSCTSSRGSSAIDGSKRSTIWLTLIPEDGECQHTVQRQLWFRASVVGKLRWLMMTGLAKRPRLE